MLKYYKNTEELDIFGSVKNAQRYTDEDLKLIEFDALASSFPQNIRDYVEFHLYDVSGNIINSNLDSANWDLWNDDQIYSRLLKDIKYVDAEYGDYKFVYNYFRKAVGNTYNNLYIKEISNTRKELRLAIANKTSSNILTDIKNFKYTLDGTYYYRLYVSTNTTPQAVAYRNSIIQKAIKNSITFEEQVELEIAWLRIYSDTAFVKDYADDFVLNFGDNKCILGVNAIFSKDFTELIIKLYEPLPLSFKEKDRLWINFELLKPLVGNVIINKVGVIVEDIFRLRGPNFFIKNDNNSLETDYESWNSLLGNNLITSQQLVNQYFSGSLDTIKLNIDYSTFDEFIHFSSATERTANFKYKLELVEFYNSRLTYLTEITGSTVNNIIDSFNKRNEVIAGFDDFEKYLYYTTGSDSIYTHITGSVQPWPKYINSGSATEPWLESLYTWNQTNEIRQGDGNILNVTRIVPKYRLYASDHPTSVSYFENLQFLSDEYDRENLDRLSNNIPSGIIQYTDNDDFILFTDMLGHHFDILWTYIRHLTSMYSREEHPKDGIPMDMISTVTNDYGWKLHGGNKGSDLWNYTLGVDEYGNVFNTGSLYSKSYEDITKEVWKRIYNNLPFLLKTKGTSRAIRSMISCYGVPSSILRIREYGGPSKRNDEPNFKFTTFKYILELDGATNYIETPWEKVEKVNDTGSYPDTVALRFLNYDDEEYDYSTREYQTIVEKNTTTPDFFVQFQHTGSQNKGNINFYLSGTSDYFTASIEDVYLFDGEPAYIFLRRRVSEDNVAVENIYDLIYSKEKYGKVLEFVSASIYATGSETSALNTSWASDSYLRAGYNDIANSNYYTGSVQEIRYWSVPLSQSVMEKHTLSQMAYSSNHETGSYDELNYRIEYTQKYDIAATSSIPSVHPNQNISTFWNSVTELTASAYGFTSESFTGIEDYQSLFGPSVGGNNIYTDKIRIDTYMPEGILGREHQISEPSTTNHPVDSNRIGIYFSHQDKVNDDIYSQFGYVNLDDYIGDPAHINLDYYPDLRRFANEYWKKYTSSNNIAEYIRAVSIFDFSLFDQLRNLLPARTNKILGLTIEPHVLERSKIRNFGAASTEYLMYSGTLDLMGIDWSIYAYYCYYEAEIEYNIPRSITGEYLSFIPDAVVSAMVANISAEYMLKQSTTNMGLRSPSVYKHSNAILDQSKSRFDSNPFFYNVYNSRDRYSPTGSVVLNQRSSRMLRERVYFYDTYESASLMMPYSSSLRYAQVQDFRSQPAGALNSLYRGSKLVGTAINENSLQTIDGGPVVSVYRVDPNQINYSDYSEDGSLDVE